MKRGAKEESQKKKEKREGERHGNACDICFQKVIPPTLSASNPNVVSVLKVSIKQRATALFNEFLKI